MLESLLKRKPRGRHPYNALNAAFVRNVDRAGRYCDGNGLYLVVRPSGSRSWVQRIYVRGRRRELGLGGYPLVSLKEARDKAFANRKLARDGGDPFADRRRAKGAVTFADAAARVWEQLHPAWRSAKHRDGWMSTMRRFVFPSIGGMSVSEVNGGDVLAILVPIWHTKAQTARSVQQRIGTVMKWAVAMDLRNDNPCDRLGPVLGPQNGTVRHMRALPHGRVAAAIDAVRASSQRPLVKLAFEFLVLTAARSGEVCGALWNEIDRAGRAWTVPASRMKTKREHRVPLSGRALEILEAARAHGNGHRLVFPSARGKRMHDQALSRMLKMLDIGAVPHGFRSSFRDWAAEKTDHPREVIEAALAHLVLNKVEAAYARSDLFERRRRLMVDWAAFLSGEGCAPDAAPR